MGIDFLDFTFQLEKKHRYFIHGYRMMEDLERVRVNRGRGCFGTQKSDWKAQDFYECLARHAVYACAQCHGKPNLHEPKCRRCRVDFPRADLTWPQFVETLAPVLARKPEEILPERWLKGDPGFN